MEEKIEVLGSVHRASDPLSPNFNVDERCVRMLLACQAKPMKRKHGDLLELFNIDLGGLQGGSFFDASQATLHTIDRSHVSLFFHLPLRCLCCIAPHGDSRKPVALVSVFLWSCLIICKRLGLKASSPFTSLIACGQNGERIPACAQTRSNA